MRIKYLPATTTLILLISMPSVYASFIDYPVHSSHWTDKYDRHFKKYSKRYFGPLFDWHWFKAQAIAESGLNDNAESHMGALGLMQIMPATFLEIAEQNPHFAEAESAHWKFEKTAAQDKLYMTFASYNAGYGRILNAAKKTPSKEKNWDEIEPLLPSETRSYVRRIRELMGDH